MNEKKQDDAIQESRGGCERGMAVLPCAFGRRPCDEWGTGDGVIRQKGVAVFGARIGVEPRIFASVPLARRFFVFAGG